MNTSTLCNELAESALRDCQAAVATGSKRCRTFLQLAQRARKVTMYQTSVAHFANRIIAERTRELAAQDGAL